MTDASARDRRRWYYRGDNDWRVARGGGGTGGGSFEGYNAGAYRGAYIDSGPRDRGMEDEERGPYGGVGPKGYVRDDTRIYDDIMTALTMHRGINARRIQVDVKKGMVRLQGLVPSRIQRYLAEDVVANTSGVIDLQNDLRVGPLT